MVGLVGREGVEKRHSYSKSKGRMTNESLTGLMFSVCNLFLGGVKDHRDFLGPHLIRAISFSFVTSPHISIMQLIV